MVGSSGRERGVWCFSFPVGTVCAPHPPSRARFLSENRSGAGNPNEIDHAARVAPFAAPMKGGRVHGRGGGATSLSPRSTPAPRVKSRRAKDGGHGASPRLDARTDGVLAVTAPNL